MPGQQHTVRFLALMLGLRVAVAGPSRPGSSVTRHNADECGRRRTWGVKPALRPLGIYTPATELVSYEAPRIMRSVRNLTRVHTSEAREHQEAVVFVNTTVGHRLCIIGNMRPLTTFTSIWKHLGCFFGAFYTLISCMHKSYECSNVCSAGPRHLTATSKPNSAVPISRLAAWTEAVP
jgi:hypothetical protein